MHNTLIFQSWYANCSNFFKAALYSALVFYNIYTSIFEDEVTLDKGCMSYKSSEKIFYEKHYGENFAASNAKIDEDFLNENYFGKGQRYHLIEDVVAEVKTRNHLVELGCSSGETLRYLAEKYQFKKSTGIDIAFSEPLVIDGPCLVEMMPANFNEQLPFADHSVDLLIAMMVIEHLFDPFHSFKEINRLLSNNGVAVINLPLVTGIKNRLRLLAGELPVTSVPFDRWLVDREWDGNHLHYFNIDSIHKLCASCNLQIFKLSAVGKFTGLKNLFPSILATELTFAVKRIS